MRVFCPDCGSIQDLTPEKWRCECGSAWETIEQNYFDLESINKSEKSIWRYLPLMGLDFENPLVRLGAGGTPLLKNFYLFKEFHFKLEYFSPTASFKDRGTAVMINILAHQGVKRVADDSSGNAGASVAAYAAGAGLQVDIFVPSYASQTKQNQIAVYGAHIHSVDGTRSDVKGAAQIFAVDEVAYASHAYHPGFLLGQQTLAWELWEQLDRQVPDWYVIPVGQGLHLLGIWFGFRRLLAAGLIDKLPRLVAVQPEICAPLVNAFEAGLDDVPEVLTHDYSVAEGLAISKPVRGKRLLQAVHETGGTCIKVSDEGILRAQQQLARKGIYVEPTSATVVAALHDLKEVFGENDLVVVPLTGSGLKGAPEQR
jgi:threonine synthase